METQAVVYKRRPRKPLQDLHLNSPSVHGTEESAAAQCQKDGSKYDSSMKSGRKSWMDRSLSNKGRRSSFYSGESFDLTDMVQRWNDIFFQHEIQAQLNVKNVTGQGNRSKLVKPPIEYVTEKQAMFAAIDAFELESEEESPASKPLFSDPYKDLYTRNNILQYQINESESASDFLSAALQTPNPEIGRSHKDKLPLDRHSDINKKQSLALVSRNDNSRTVLSSTGELSPNASSESETRLVCLEELVAFEAESSGVKDIEIRLSIDSSAALPTPKSLQVRIDEVSTLTTQLQELNPLAEDDEGETPKTADRDQAKDTQAPSAPEIEDVLPIFEALLYECQQTQPTTLRNAFSEFCDMAKIAKVGEGTFGEAFRGGGCVFKIVPMDGKFLVNSEVQKTSAEIYSEALVTTTLNRLRGQGLHDSQTCANYCINFIETKAIRICQGSYGKELCTAWEDWDTLRTSENDHPMVFPEHQLYVVFVLADGGTDLESFVLSDVMEAKSVLLQITVALAVAEEGCGFEHRDLHWGNVVLRRNPEEASTHYKLLGNHLEAKTVGLSVSIIDFTLSRIDTGKQVFFSNLSADPALFQGPPRDVQANTYRRMQTKTQGNWEGSYPQTNCYWIHYVADILLKKKTFRCGPQEKRALRSFCKRVLLYESAKAAVSDNYFEDMWIKGLLS